jgi:hypothetical protein
MAYAKKATGPIQVSSIDHQTLQVAIVGVTPFLPQGWRESSLDQMRAKQQGTKPVGTRAAKQPEEEAAESTYWVSVGQPGCPAGAFKSALVSAVGLFDGMTKVSSKLMLSVRGEGPRNLVPILDGRTDKQIAEDGRPEFWETREFQVRNATGVADLRYFNVIMPWRAVLNVSFPPSLVSADAVVSLVKAAGNFVGVGGYRPSSPKVSSGTYGCWDLHYES